MKQNKVISTLLNNWVAKIFSILIALFIVISVRFLNVNDRVVTLPLEVTLPADYEALSLVPSTVDVVITGDDSIIYLVDPMHIKSAWDESSRDVYGWLGYAFDFIDEIRYRSIDESVILAVDRYSTLSGDTLGLYSGLMHGWDGRRKYSLCRPLWH